MTPARYRELDREATEAYNQARYREAAVLREQARHLAQQHRLPREAFASGVWAADSWALAGEPLRALTLLGDLLRAVPTEADSQDVWNARLNAFEIQRVYFPRLAALRQRLAELETLQSEQPSLPAADIQNMHANLQRHQGRWADSLRHYERGWNVWILGKGYAKYNFAYQAVLACLPLGDAAAARDWCAALGETETHLPSSRAAWQEAQAQLALYQQQPQQAAQCAAALEELYAAMQRIDYSVDTWIRARLLQLPTDDPQAAAHPARCRFARRTAGKPNVSAVYARRLLLLDYRLACLRWALGIEAVDDLWYTQAHDLSRAALRVSPRAAQQRVFLARRAVARAMRQAAFLDECFETEIYTQEVQQHAQRLEELATIVWSAKP